MYFLYNLNNIPPFGSPPLDTCRYSHITLILSGGGGGVQGLIILFYYTIIPPSALPPPAPTRFVGMLLNWFVHTVGVPYIIHGFAPYSLSSFLITIYSLRIHYTIPHPLHYSHTSHTHVPIHVVHQGTLGGTPVYCKHNQHTI